MSARLFNRGGGAPRSVLIMTALLLVAVGALLVARQRKPAFDYTLGGPLFPVDKDRIEGLLLTRQGSQYRLDKVAEGTWSLSGAAADYVDSLAVLQLLDNLAVAGGGPLLPGTDVEDRRYEFNGSEAVRLTVFIEGADPISLAVGAGNPVRGNFYASGAGRDACFMVSAGLRKTLGEFPLSVQARKLLPGVSEDRVERIDLRRGSRDFLLEKREGRWWMQMPPEGPAYLGDEVRDYQAMYSDRRVTDGGGTWILASSAAVSLMIYEVSDIIVRDIKPPTESVTLSVAWDLDPPWRQVTLTGKGLNPDPNSGTPDRMTIAFGPALNEETVPALRRGHVLVSDGEALNVLGQPLGILAHRTALTFLALQADVITLEREGLLVLRGTRTGTAVTADGRKAWLTEFPPAGSPGLEDKLRHGFSRDLAVNLGRIPVLAVLPPTSNPAVLVDKERVKITVVFGTGEDVRAEVLEFGFIAAGNLPDGAAPLVLTEDGAPAAGLWFPSNGRLLQVPAQILVTARNMARLALPDSQ